MSKLMSLVCIALLTCAVKPANNEFHKFHVVETYEVQPGILMVPTYSSTGAVCQVVLEKRHYSAEEVDLDAAMSHEQIWQIFDQLVPHKDRGRPTLDLGETGELTTTGGVATTTIADYENVSLEMDRKTSENDNEYVVAIIQWKKRNCS